MPLRWGAQRGRLPERQLAARLQHLLVDSVGVFLARSGSTTTERVVAGRREQRHRHWEELAARLQHELVDSVAVLLARRGSRITERVQASQKE